MTEINGLRAAIEALGGNLEDWTVLGEGTDPFRMDTPGNHREAGWLRNTMIRQGLADKRIHNRGIHYAVLTQPKPDGCPYGSRPIVKGIDPDWIWLQKVSVAARWLNYVDWEQIKDERNSEPVFRLWTPPEPNGYVATDSYFYLPDADDLTPKAKLDDFRGSRRYHLAMIGEKVFAGRCLGADCAGTRVVSLSADRQHFQHAHLGIGCQRGQGWSRSDRLLLLRLRPVGMEHAD